MKSGGAIILPLLGVLLYFVSTTATAARTHPVMGESFDEPISDDENVLLYGYHSHYAKENEDSKLTKITPKSLLGDDHVRPKQQTPEESDEPISDDENVLLYGYHSHYAKESGDDESKLIKVTPKSLGDEPIDNAFWLSWKKEKMI
ncbi:uncharacterized protein LOC133783760 [Humulus lupulus]|uniref:uncharacterized protein LOC133783760 n=1 Tax=Humulus lupulus TaxID=3486 RepID=UPI002B409D8E|nr:uncharacterized protein LOC133783760 [Humulus lupulus]